MTVSRVVNKHPSVSPSTRRKVEETIERLGYLPNHFARGLKGNRSSTIGILVPDITNPYFPEIVRGIEDEARTAGFTVLLNNAMEKAERERSTLQIFEERRVDGVIVCSSRLSPNALTASLRRHPAAVVVNRVLPPNVAGVVRVDHEYGARSAVEHMLAMGRNRIGVLAGPEGSYSGEERLLGITRTLADHGLQLDDSNMLFSSPYLDSGYEAAYRVLSQARGPDALLCFNDVMAAGALQAAAALGLEVPRDVAIVGHDDIPYAAMFSPPLSTLHVPKYDLGVNAMRMLLDRLESRNVLAEVVLKPRLIVRETTFRDDSSSSAGKEQPQS